MNLSITHIHTYLVPERGNAEEPEGVTIPLRGKLFEIANGIFQNSAQIQPLNVRFVPDATVGQTNVVRSLIIDYGLKKTLHKGLKLAQRLKDFTTKRSKSGLLMLMAGQNGTQTSVCICRFPAEEGIMANKTGKGLKVEFLEKVFLKDAHSFKSVIYEGVDVKGGCWIGQAIDRQINDTVREVSDYWIKGYLQSDYQTKPKAGTQRLAIALRKAISNAQTAEIKMELISLGVILRNYQGKIIRPETMCYEARISDASRIALNAAFPNKMCVTDPFQLDLDEYDKLINLKTIELDNGAIVMAPLSNFDDVVSIEEGKEGKSVVSSEGRIVKTLIKGVNK